MDVTFESHIGDIQKAKTEKMRTALKMCGMQAESYAKDLALHDTGLMRNSITFALDGEGANITEYSDDHKTQRGTYKGTMPKEKTDAVYIGSNVEYAPYIELGHHTVSGSLVSPHPFLRPAIELHTKEYKEIIESVLKS